MLKIFFIIKKKIKYYHILFVEINEIRVNFSNQGIFQTKQSPGGGTGIGPIDIFYLDL